MTANTAERLTNVARRQDYPNCRPRDASTLIIVDLDGGTPKILMGRRHEGHVFMPGKFVFPGGRIDRSDCAVSVPDTLDPAVEAKLLADMKGKPSARRAQGLGLAAIRETFEETGLLIGKPASNPMTSKSPVWRPFAERGLTPALADLSLFCRAITPPRRPRRYDTRFFVVSSELVAGRLTDGDGELLDLHWLTFSKAFELDLPPITKVVLEELQGKLARGALPSPGDDVPYYFMRNGAFRRELL